MATECNETHTVQFAVPQYPIIPIFVEVRQSPNFDQSEASILAAILDNTEASILAAILDYTSKSNETHAVEFAMPQYPYILFLSKSDKLKILTNQIFNFGGHIGLN